MARKHPKHFDTFINSCIHWSPVAGAMFGKDIANGEGRGEISWRWDNGFDLALSKGSCDIPEANKEIKCISKVVKGKQDVCSLIRMGKSKEDISYGTAFKKVIEWETIARKSHQFLPFIDEDIILAFMQGYVKNEMLTRLPDPLRSEIMELWNPATVMNYDGLILTAHPGYIEIPKIDLSKAFSFTSTTQFRLQFSFDWTYLETKVV